MLRYEINTKELENNYQEIPIEHYEIEENPDNNELLIVTCYYEDNLNLTYTTNLTVTSYYDVDIATLGTTETITLIETPEIYELNSNYRYFSFNIDRYHALSIKNIEIMEMNSEVYLKFSFVDYHYFNSWNDEITFYATFRGDDGVLYEKEFSNCIFDDEYTLLWRYNLNSPGIVSFMCTVFHADEYTFVGYNGNEDSIEYDSVPTNPCFTDDIYIKVPVRVGCDDRYEFYEKNCNDGDVSMISAYREQFFIGDFTVSAELGNVKLTVPLSQMHDVTLQQEDNIMSKFVYDETNAAINNFVEMEKFVYYPAIWDEQNGVFENVHKIKFNLHFRQHRGENWSVDDDTYWNGVYINSSNQPELMSAIRGADGMPTDSDNAIAGTPFFSYLDFDRQSDLLTYLNFTNNDVKYQKNKLKKSFLRLSFYDSDNPTNQNMLAYATIFLDGGKLFSRYMNNVDTKGYVLSGAVSEDDYGNKFVGSKVNMEFYPAYTGEQISDNELEEHRLSSQISVTEPYSSQSSSEGFNLYLWADNDNGSIPSDIYMKVEFNHAGYGRTVPFMMPYKHGYGLPFNSLGIKGFNEIIDDWRYNDGYGMKEFLRYSYIHFKYRYDKENDKRIYYLDPETYGESVLYKNDNDLVINLYEAKVKFKIQEEE